MLKFLSTFIVSVAVYGAELTEFRMITSYGTKSSAYRAKGSGAREVTVFSGDDVLPQMANGDGWRTQIFLVNLATVRLPFIVDFWKGDGSPWQVAIGGVGTGDQITGSLAPGATAVFETTGQGSLVQGWAELTYDFKIGKIGGFGVFRQSVAGRPDFEAVVPLSSLFDKVIVLPYDNTAGFSTGVACVNGGPSSPATITATFRDETGTTYATETIQLPQSGHTAFAMAARFPTTQGRRGTVLFRSSTDFLSVMGLRFNPGGSFTSFTGLNTVELNP
ncbi:MAG: hypothetical protein ACKV2U_05660 [Bryobacteraceae bacterium]